MKKIYLLLAALFAGCASVDQNPIKTASLNLPSSTDWKVANQQGSTDQYVREWLPAANTFDDTKWLVVEQKLPANTSAKTFIHNMFAMARSTCTDVLYNMPQRYDINGKESYVGRIMCAQQHGKPYGLFNDVRVISDGHHIYTVISETRFAPMAKAGLFSFEKGADVKAEVDEIMQRLQASDNITRHSVKLCLNDGSGC